MIFLMFYLVLQRDVTLAGVDFAIPDGFSEVENESVYNQKIDNPNIDLNFLQKYILMLQEMQ